MIELKKDLLDIKVFDSRGKMGAAAAEEATAYIKEILKKKDEINIVFAAAPSQDDFLEAFSKKPIEWGRINAYHMDEYVGLSRKDPQSFGHYLDEHIFNLVPFKSVHYIAKEGLTAEDLCKTYCSELEKIKIDIVCMGVGENGHIAFNDPEVANFSDPELAKIVKLDNICRMQQVHDKCFPSIENVPTHAITLTIPTLMSADRIFNIVPTERKAEAIRKAIKEPISEKCPASILRKHKAATLYLDEESSKYLIS
ncbi:MAG: 6-phosphogluconolactonase [Bacteroidales bacterium]|jgi:glucosamine-6-phosphate deaminase|nr:6-phosphogluconolactonase [Bacteroidales bacterium]